MTLPACIARAADHAAFLRAVVASPDDDLPRLIYADFLDEQGDAARAEFIRVGVEVAKYKWCPNTRKRGTLYGLRAAGLTCGKCCCCQLREREKELARRHAHQWTRELSFWEGAVEQQPAEVYEYRRGFVEELTLHWSHFDRDGHRVLTECPVRQLTLTHIGDCVLPAVTTLPRDGGYETELGRIRVEWNDPLSIRGTGLLAIGGVRAPVEEMEISYQTQEFESLNVTFGLFARPMLRPVQTWKFTLGPPIFSTPEG